MNDITIQHAEPPYSFEAYAHVVEPLGEEDGGGFLISFPDLPGCMSDGETVDEAAAKGRDAFSAWISARIHMGRSIPRPPRHGQAREPVEPVQRLPCGS